MGQKCALIGLLAIASLPNSSMSQSPVPPPAAPVQPNAQPAAKGPVRGKVLDEQGKPVKGATVTGVAYTVSSNSSSAGRIDDEKTNELGEFSVPMLRVAGFGTLALSAWKDGAFTAKPTELKGKALDQPVVLTINPRHGRALTGRAVDDRGEAIRSAKVQVFHVPTAPPGFEYGLCRPANFPLPNIVTDAEGKFAFPPQLDPDGSYRVALTASGHSPGRSRWTKMPDQGALTMGNVTLARTRVIEGQVVDRQGKPVAGAQVVRAGIRQRKTTVTDGDGHFKLEAVAFPVGVLVSHKDGYRATGQRCDQADKVKLIMFRRDEPCQQAMETLAPALSSDERKSLAAKLLEPEWEKSLASQKDNDRLRVLEWQARINPGRVLEDLEKRPVQSEWIDGYIRRAVAKQIARQSFDEARAVIDSMRDPGFRSTGYFDLCDSLNADRKADRISCIDQAILHSKAVASNDHRIIYLGHAGRRLFLLNETERATVLLREGQVIAKQLPTAGWGGYARGAFAEDLGVIDLPGALDLMKDLKDPYEFNRHHSNLARKIAGFRSAEAEEISKNLTESDTQPSSIQFRQRFVPLCFLMAMNETGRAKQLAGKPKEPLVKAQAFGAIARALAKTKPQEALRALDEAFTILGSNADTGNDHFVNLPHGAAIAGLLVPIAEQIDKTLVAEFFWRAASFGVPSLPSRYEDDDDLLAESIGATALVLAPYDRPLALALVEQAVGLGNARPNLYIGAAALANPQRAIELVEKLTDERVHGDVRRIVAGMLMAEGDGIWRRIHSTMFVWHPEDDFE